MASFGCVFLICLYCHPYVIFSHLSCTSDQLIFVKHKSQALSVCSLKTESKNHKRFDVGMVFQRSLSPSPLLKKDHQSQLPTTMSRQFLNIANNWRVYNHCGKPVPVLTVKKCFLMFRQNLLCFSLCLLLCVLSLRATQKRWAPLSSSYQIFTHIDKLHSNFLFSRLNNPVCLSLFLLGNMLQNYTQSSRCGHTSAEQRGSPLLTCKQCYS